jgi:hypothetical protein
MTTHGYCPICEKHNLLVPLHDDKGGQEVCLMCAGKWHAEHGRRRKAGRIVIRAINAYVAAGGSWNDIPKLKDSALLSDYGMDPLGYLRDAVQADGDVVDLTTELLDAAVRLTRPDCHPPERRDLAHHVTQELLALRPFVFPAPKPEPVVPIAPGPPRNGSSHAHHETLKDALRKFTSYPCTECASTVPYFYCTSCKAEHEKRRFEERTLQKAKQRAWYKTRKARRDLWKPGMLCPVCNTTFKSKRKDARFCSAACRQAAHRATCGKVNQESTP